MRRALVGVAVALLALLALLAAGCGGDETQALPEGRALAATSAIVPEVALFGDLVEARADVLVKDDELDPDRLLFEPDFAPYEVVGEPVVERKRTGDFTQLRYRYALRCITLDCIELIGGGPSQPGEGGIPPPVTGGGGFGERKTIQLKPTPLRYDDPEGEERTLRRISWPPVQSISRMNLGDTTVTGIGFPFQASVTPLPDPTFRVPPLALAAGLLIAAAALLALPVIVFGRMLRREPEVLEVEAPRVLTPLERALELVAWAREHGTQAEQREALEVLAEELDAEGRTSDVAEARRLAWSAAPPSPDRMEELVERLGEGDGSAD
jgi:hypothetical protein